MVVSQVDQDQIKKLEIKDRKKKQMNSPMNVNCLNHLMILGGRTAVQMFTSMSIQVLFIGQTYAVRNKQKDIKAMHRKSAALIYVQGECGLTEANNFRSH